LAGFLFSGAGLGVGAAGKRREAAHRCEGISWASGAPDDADTPRAFSALRSGFHADHPGSDLCHIGSLNRRARCRCPLRMATSEIANIRSTRPRRRPSTALPRCSPRKSGSTASR